MVNRIEGRSLYYLEEEFRQLPLLKKITTFAVVFFATILSCGSLYETSFEYMINKFRKEPAPSLTKTITVDLTKKPKVDLSNIDKLEIEKGFDKWINGKNVSHINEYGIKKRAVSLAALYVLDKGKDDNVKNALIEILENKFKSQEETSRKVNRRFSPPIRRKDDTLFKETKTKVNSEGQKVIVSKRYQRLKTVGDGSCGYHALLGKLNKNGYIETELSKRKDFCDRIEDLIKESTPEIIEKEDKLKNDDGSFKTNSDGSFKTFKEIQIINDKFPKMMSSTLSEIFVALVDEKEEAYLKDYISTVKDTFKSNYKKQAKEYRELEKSFDIKTQGENPERKEAIHKLNRLKAEFITDKKVRMLYLAHIRKTGVYAQVSEIVVAARYFNIPLILHRNGNVSEKYPVGEGIDPEMVDVKDEKKLDAAAPKPKVKTNWVHIYHQGNHFERVKTLKRKILEKAPA